MKKRRHHYVWRNHLRAWSDSEYIWCVRGDKVFEANLVNVAQERDFYRLNELTNQELYFLNLLIGQQPNEMLRNLNEEWVRLFSKVFEIRNAVNTLGIGNDEFEAVIENKIINLGEDLHCQIEGGAVKFLKGLLEDGTNFFTDENNNVEFIHYLCIQYFRTKCMKDGATSSVAGLGMFDTNKAWNILSQVFATSLAWTIYAERSGWNMVFLENHTPSPLLTGDQPIVNTYAAFGRQVNGYDELEFYYPLSPKKAILLTKKNEYKDTPLIALDDIKVNHYNDIMIDMSHEQIYSASQDQLVMLVKKRCSPPATL